jgi:hypothetical protein
VVCLAGPSRPDLTGNPRRTGLLGGTPLGTTACARVTNSDTRVGDARHTLALATGSAHRPREVRDPRSSPDNVKVSIMDGVALTSVIASAAVGIVGVAVPAVVRWGERKDERAMRVRDRRAEAYTTVLRLMQQVDTLDQNEVGKASKESAVLTWLWGSREVRELFWAWLQLIPTRYGPDATAVDRQSVLAAANAVRERMADEVQGRAKVD